jgi:hypothetical protein
MRSLRRLLQRLFPLFMAVVVWADSLHVAWAQEGGGSSSEEDGKGYGATWGLILLCVVLGLLLVLRPVNRPESDKKGRQKEE